MIVIVNLATFLQGASLPTSSISVPRLLEGSTQSLNDTTWPRDFNLSMSEGDWIGKGRLGVLSHKLYRLVHQIVH